MPQIVLTPIGCPPQMSQYTACHSLLLLQDGLKAVAGCLDSGYTGFGVMRRDPDMAPLRESPKFEGLLKRFEPGGGFLGGFLKGFN